MSDLTIMSTRRLEMLTIRDGGVGMAIIVRSFLEGDGRRNGRTIKVTVKVTDEGTVGRLR